MEFMYRLLIVAILLVTTAPLYAQRQQGNIAKLKADPQKVVSIISGDEAKNQSYCEARDIAERLVQAAQQKDNEKVEDLSNKLIEQQKDLGSEYLALMESLRSVILSPKDTQEIEAMFDRLDESCPQNARRISSSRTRRMTDHGGGKRRAGIQFVASGYFVARPLAGPKVDEAIRSAGWHY